MRKLFIFIVIIQFVAISILVVYIFQKRNKVLGVQFNPINQNDIVVATDSGKLKYFYQPPSNYTERVKNTWIADEVIYTYNSDTLNERYDYQIQKPPKSFRIVTLGDSFTFGLYVNTKDNYPEKLEDKLNSVCNNNPNVEVINLGMQGYDIEYSVERYKKRGVKYQPDLVIWFINSWNYLKIIPGVDKPDYQIRLIFHSSFFIPFNLIFDIITLHSKIYYLDIRIIVTHGVQFIF